MQFAISARTYLLLFIDLFIDLFMPGQMYEDKIMWTYFLHDKWTDFFYFSYLTMIGVKFVHAYVFVLHHRSGFEVPDCYFDIAYRFVCQVTAKWNLGTVYVHMKMFLYMLACISVKQWE